MNLLVFSGNLGGDCEVKQVGGKTVCNFSVAMRAGYGEREQTIWIRCALWGARAEGKLPGYLKKGQRVVVHGELSTHEHDGKTYLQVRCDNVELSGGRDNVSHDEPTPVADAGTKRGGWVKPPAQQAPAASEPDDDIPF